MCPYPRHTPTSHRRPNSSSFEHHAGVSLFSYPFTPTLYLAWAFFFLSSVAFSALRFLAADCSSLCADRLGTRTLICGENCKKLNFCKSLQLQSIEVVRN